jgi:hypothetical protein
LTAASRGPARGLRHLEVRTAVSLEASVAAKSAALIPKRTTIDDCSMFEQRSAYCHPDLYHEEVLDLDSPFVTKVRCLRQE